MLYHHIAGLLLGFLPHLHAMAVAAAEPGKEQFSVLEKRSITCLTVGETATATWTNSVGQKCTFSGVVGSNYGTNSAGEGEYVFRSLKRGKTPRKHAFDETYQH